MVGDLNQEVSHTKHGWYKNLKDEEAKLPVLNFKGV